jgi:hypothetical protein
MAPGVGHIVDRAEPGALQVADVQRSTACPHHGIQAQNLAALRIQRVGGGRRCLDGESDRIRTGSPQTGFRVLLDERGQTGFCGP